MAKKVQLTEQELYDLLLSKYDSSIASGFLKSIDDLTSQADVDRLVAAIKARDIEAALTALHIQQQAFDPMVEQIRLGFMESGTTAVDFMPNIADAAGNVTAIVRFSVRNPRAEKWLADKSSQLITDITDDQRTAIKQALVAGMEAGQNPRDTAIDIVGKYDSKLGERTGGIIGLTAQQESFVSNAYDELSSGDPSQLADYLDRNMRDQRFDSIVNDAIDSGNAIDSSDIDLMTQRYSDRLLKMRGDTIGRTESLTAVRAGKYEAYQQAIDTGGLQQTSVTKIWQTAGDNHVRDSHAELDGIEVEGIDEPFQSSTGAEMLYPGDTSLGADAEDVINCRCDCAYIADFLSTLANEEDQSS